MLTLKNSTTEATINPDGAWVEELSVSGRPILFPKTELTNENGDRKARGGMHVCLPNFGPGGDSALPQHGFGRTSTWKVVQHNPSSVTLELKNAHRRYAGLVATLVYTLQQGSLLATLSLQNVGPVALRVAPGFHPYFYVDESEKAVSVNDVVYELANLAGTEYVRAETAILRTSEITISLHQEGLPTWAIWTDGLAEYVCVEPTYGGYRFLETPTPEEHLRPGETRSYSVQISW